MSVRVYIGSIDDPQFIFEDESITSMNLITEANVIMDTMSADTAEISVNYEDEDEELESLAWGTPVIIYRNEKVDAKLYVKTVTRTGKNSYSIDATSAVGLFEYDTFYGGMYTGETFQEAVEGVIKTNGITTVEEYGTKVNLDLHNTTSGKQIYYVQSPRIILTIWRIKFTLNAVYADEYLEGTSGSIPIAGDCLISSTGSNIFGKYGLEMYMERESEDDDWPEFGELRLAIADAVIPLATVTEPTTFEIEVVPCGLQSGSATGYVKVNGTTYTFTKPTASRYMHIFFPGHHVGYCNIDIESFKYSNAYLDEGDIDYQEMSMVDLLYIKHLASDFLTMYNIVRKEKYSSTILRGTIIDGITIQHTKSYQEEILSSIRYAPGIAELQIYGWLPICTRREALHQILISNGIVMMKDEDGNILMAAPAETEIQEIEEGDIYNSGSVSKLERVNWLNVTEHSYVYDNEKDLETVYETSTAAGADCYIAEFEASPIYDEGATISGDLIPIAMNCNAAILTGTGEVKAIPYIHSKKEIKRTIGDYTDGKEIAVTDATLVTLQNSAYMMDRMAAYYGSAYLVESEIKMRNERAGGYYELTSPFGDTVRGFLRTISRTYSAIVKGACSFICGYSPPKINGSYSDYVILTGSGTWEVPASVFEKDTPRIYVILVGGGQGGSSGCAGHDGETTQKMSSSTAAEGGSAGEAGTGGDIYEIEIINPAASYDYSAGTGGAGGAICYSTENNNAGTMGTASTLTDGDTTWSSEDGETSETGVTNLFTGEIYAKRLKYLEKDGAAGGWIEYNSETGNISWWNGYDIIFSFAPWFYFGGSTGAALPASGKINATGGTGGGAAMGSSGSDGTDATRTGFRYNAGDGGDGGNATWTPQKATDYDAKFFGYGGNPGAGGGGGGCSGWATTATYTLLGTPGSGGYGGQGGDGGDGCILIYY